MAIALSVCALFAIGVAPAATASPAKQGYDETTVLGNVGSGGPTAGETTPVAQTTTQPTSSSSLPFTGADIGILVLMGVVLGTTGIVLRRIVRQRPTA